MGRPHCVWIRSICPSLKHYRAVEVFIPTTNNTRICASLFWLPHKNFIPSNTPDERLMRSIQHFILSYQAYQLEHEDTLTIPSTVLNYLRQLGFSLQRQTLTSLPTPLQITLPDTRTTQSSIRHRDRQELFARQQDTLSLYQPSELCEQQLMIKADRHQQAINLHNKHVQRRREVLEALSKPAAHYVIYDDPFDNQSQAQYCYAAKKQRTPDNPSFQKVTKDPNTEAMWDPPYQAEVGGLIEIGAFEETTQEIAINTPNSEIIPSVIGCKVKRLSEISTN